MEQTGDEGQRQVGSEPSDFWPFNGKFISLETTHKKSNCQWNASHAVESHVSQQSAKSLHLTHSHWRISDHCYTFIHPGIQKKISFTVTFAFTIATILHVMQGPYLSERRELSFFHCKCLTSFTVVLSTVRIWIPVFPCGLFTSDVLSDLTLLCDDKKLCRSGTNLFWSFTVWCLEGFSFC